MKNYFHYFLLPHLNWFLRTDYNFISNIRNSTLNIIYDLNNSLNLNEMPAKSLFYYLQTTLHMHDYKMCCLSYTALIVANALRPHQTKQTITFKIHYSTILSPLQSRCRPLPDANYSVGRNAKQTHFPFRYRWCSICAFVRLLKEFQIATLMLDHL